MSGLNRFQIAASPKKRFADEFPPSCKDLHDVKKYNAPGIFYVRAKVTDLQFALYKACPNKIKGLPCKKKLDAENHCDNCGQRANLSLRGMYMRLDLQDCNNPEINQQATLFAFCAESYLDMKVEQFAAMVEQRPEKLEALLQSKIGQIISVKLSLKAKGEHGLLDWVISAIIEEKKKEVAVDEGHNGDGTEEGEIIHLMVVITTWPRLAASR
ncbi:hypothetical protein niasHS_008367 [Heterodera schachtii]|uniref:Replication factor A C-terminal domain-containing protein n=1 Tax=Heterodera schachtii TaxID=97005 RepID=A0ABD2J867_HETSC